MKNNVQRLIYPLMVMGIICVLTNSCKKDDKDDTTTPTPTPTGNTVSDIDGNVYHTVTIGTQVWMVENLKTTKYRDGSSIPNVSNSTWSTLTTGAYRDYNNTPSISNTYGRLYNWYAITDSRNIAPTGWHVPTYAEINTLVTYLGGIGVAGGKLKASSSNTPAWDGTNSSGFTALPAGYTITSFNGQGSKAYFWTTTETNTTQGKYFGLGTGYASTFYLDDVKTGGFSVRCVKD